ncbi:UNVERIFIED_CONTAM: hypothetical protein K2H54_003239 [Gekko kuhli]
MSRGILRVQKTFCGHQVRERKLKAETGICEAAKIHNLLEQELAHAVNACSHALNGASLRFPESLTRNIALEVAVSVKALHDETESLLVGRVPLQLESPHEELLSMAVQSLEAELRKLAEIPWLHYVLQLNDDETSSMSDSSASIPATQGHHGMILRPVSTQPPTNYAKSLAQGSAASQGCPISAARTSDPLAGLPFLGLSPGPGLLTSFAHHCSGETCQGSE